MRSLGRARHEPLGGGVVFGRGERREEAYVCVCVLTF